MSDPDPIEVSRNTYIYNENRIVRKGLLLYYDPLFVSDLGSSTLSGLNTIVNTYPATDPTGILYPTGINASLFNILLASLNYPLEQSESVNIYSESHIVRRGLLFYYDPLLCSDLNSLSLSYLNTLDTTLPSVDPTGTSYPIGINASLLNIIIQGTSGSILHDEFLINLLTGTINGTFSLPGHGKRFITDVENNIDIYDSSIRGFYQPTSPVWGESKSVFTQDNATGFNRVIGRTLIGLYTSMDQLANQAFGWDTSTSTNDPTTVGHGFMVSDQGSTVFSNLGAIEPGQQIMISQNGTAIRSSQYLVLVSLNDVGAYILLSTFGTDIGDGLELPVGDIVGIPQYPLARVVWVSLKGTTSLLYPYISGYNAASGGYPPGHIWEDIRITDISNWVDKDFLASFADRCERSNSSSTIGPLWTNRNSVFGISGSQTYLVGGGTGFAIATANSGIFDGIYQFDIKVNSDWNGSNAWFGAVLRYTDINNYVKFHNNASQAFYLQTVVGGVNETTILAGGLPGGNLVAGQTYRFTIMMYGNAYKVWVDGMNWNTQWTTDPNSRFLTSTLFGTYSHPNYSAKDMRWDNFIVTPLTISLPTEISNDKIPSVWIPGITLANDTFTGVNGTRLNVHTPESGGAWNEISGTWTIQSNKATVALAAGANIVLQDVGVLDYECSVDITQPNPLGAAIFVGIVVRYTDINNYVYFREADDTVFQPNNHEIEMRWVVGGVEVMSSKTTMLVAFPAASTRTFTIRVKGNLCEVFLDGSPRGCRILPTELAVGTKCGLYADPLDGGAKFDNWVVKAL